MIKRTLILFSGTKSFSKELERYGVECKSVDIDKKFSPTFCVDLNTWDYKEDLKDWIPDYIHASPICTEFTCIKYIFKCEGHKRDMKKGLDLIEKTFEIINYFKELNPNLKWTLENPKGLLRKQKIMEPYQRITTTYCRYGFLYRKCTDFWYGGFDLQLKKPCRFTKDKKNWCISMKSNDKHHLVAIKFSKSNKYMRDFDYFSFLRGKYNIKGYMDKHFRYRIPAPLIRDIYKCLLK